jgi:hypothetical protein
MVEWGYCGYNFFNLLLWWLKRCKYTSLSSFIFQSFFLFACNFDFHTGSFETYLKSDFLWNIFSLSGVNWKTKQIFSRDLPVCQKVDIRNKKNVISAENAYLVSFT